MAPLTGLSQKFVEPGKQDQFNITVNHDDYTVKTQILSHNKDIKVNNDRIYMWYTSQKIMETKGGFEGKLIHGKYNAFYLNNQLKEQGAIKYGLKNKEWKYWYSDGKLKEVITWKNGVKNGSYALYNDYGQIMAKGNFCNDKLDGKFTTYGPAGNVTETKKYKDGVEVPMKVKSQKSKAKSSSGKTQKEVIEGGENKKKESFFKRIFRKKDKAAREKSKKTEKKSVTA
ncbi:MAG: hypothetical protein K0S32_1152 [Bacteroidetes bacterium]|jgi:antitoxin component YwqK of YwqJK toxin-antitoxin module|nr:hypothetical protein [Bacteroidota bacterium]